MREQNERRARQLAHFKKNEERWVESKDFLLKGDISEKNLLYLRPLTFGTPPHQIASNNDLSSHKFRSMSGKTKKFLVTRLKNQDRWYDKSSVNNANDLST